MTLGNGEYRQKKTEVTMTCRSRHNKLGMFSVNVNYTIFIICII